MVKKNSDGEKINSLTHHTYVVRGGEYARKLIFDSITELGVELERNPDFYHVEFVVFGVDDARQIKNLAEKKSFEERGRKFFLIEALSMTREAQNSLLKILEEPPTNTYFFIFGNCVQSLIPTILSRSLVIGSDDKNSLLDEFVEDFIKSSISKRISFVKKMADDIKDEKRSRAEAVRFVQGLEQYIYKEFQSNPKAFAGKMEKIEICRDFINDRSSSVKMILDYLAIIIPKI